MIPRIFSNQKQLDKRKLIFNQLRMTSHWPNKTKLFPVFPQIYRKPIKK